MKLSGKSRRQEGEVDVAGCSYLLGSSFTMFGGKFRHVSLPPRHAETVASRCLVLAPLQRFLIFRQTQQRPKYSVRYKNVLISFQPANFSSSNPSCSFALTCTSHCYLAAYWAWPLDRCLGVTAPSTGRRRLRFHLGEITVLVLLAVDRRRVACTGLLVLCLLLSRFSLS